MKFDLNHGAMRAAFTLFIGAVGAGVFWLIGAPIPILLGPAIAVSLAGLGGARVDIAGPLRTMCFVALGIAVGSGFDADALAAMALWPLAFVVMAVLIFVILVASRSILVRWFGFDARSALLAAAPGHLSFVLAVAADTHADVARISVTQSVRLLALTLVVPFGAAMMGVDMRGSVVPTGPVLGLMPIAVLSITALILGRLFLRIKMPAPVLMGAMVGSAMGHVTGVTPGALPGWLLLPAYLVLGCLIGTRFAGITPAALRSGFGAGIAITGVAAGLSALAAWPVAAALGMPVAHVLVAFAPGGLETMIAIGAVLAVAPGFVAGCHIMRLLVLSVLLPLMLARGRAKP